MVRGLERLPGRTSGDGDLPDLLCGVYDTVVSASKGHFKGGKNLVFNLKNNGVGVGKITPQITQKHPAWVKLMKQFKSKIIHHKLKVPAVLP